MLRIIQIWRGNAYLFKGLVFGYWIVTINPGFDSCISDTVFQSLKQNLMQMSSSFKSPITKMQTAHNMCNNTHSPKNSTVDDGSKSTKMIQKIIESMAPNSRKLSYLPFAVLVARSGTFGHAFIFPNRYYQLAGRKYQWFQVLGAGTTIYTAAFLVWDMNVKIVPTFFLRCCLFLHSPTNVRHFSVKKKNTRPRAATRPFHIFRSCSSFADDKLPCWLPWWVCACECECECRSPIIAYTKECNFS